MEPTPQPTSNSLQKLNRVFKTYGKLAIGTHICLSILSYGACYAAVQRGVDIKQVISKIGIDTTSPRWENASHAMLAYIAYKTLFPVRAPITIAVVPVLARILKY